MLPMSSKSRGVLSRAWRSVFRGPVVPHDDRERKLSPPAPRALDFHPVRIENGIVKVDVGTRLKRTTFDAGQATYA